MHPPRKDTMSVRPKQTTVPEKPTSLQRVLAAQKKRIEVETESLWDFFTNVFKEDKKTYNCREYLINAKDWNGSRGDMESAEKQIRAYIIYDICEKLSDVNESDFQQKGSFHEFIEEAARVVMRSNATVESKQKAMETVSRAMQQN